MRGLAARLIPVATLAVVFGGCLGGPGVESPDQAGVPGTPVGRTAHVRSGEVTYRLGDVTRTADGVRVDLALQNGTSRYYRSLLLRVRAHGPEGEQVTVRAPSGGLHPTQVRTVSARFPPLGFALRDVSVELLATTE